MAPWAGGALLGAKVTPPRARELYGARLNFFSDGSVHVKMWVWDGQRNDRHEVLADQTFTVRTAEGSDAVDQALYHLGRSFRERRRLLARRARAMAQAMEDR